MTNFAPKTPDELSRIIAELDAPAHIKCFDTKSMLGNIADAPHVISMKKFSKVEIYEPEELILELGPATRISAVEKLLSAKNQMLAFEPPDHSALFGSAHEGSIGGLVATALSGPRRIKAGAVRDHVLGFSGVTGAGLVFKSGARVVKNVTGYDLPKLLTGSFGTLAALTSITLKVLPRPEAEITLQIPCTNPAQACRTMADAMASSAEISAAAFTTENGVLLRLDGILPSINSRIEMLQRQFKNTNLIKAKQSEVLWKNVRDLKLFHALPQHAIWRVSVAPMAAPDFMERIRHLEPQFQLDWAGGLIWLAIPEHHTLQAQVIRTALSAGHVMLYRASLALRQTTSAFTPQPSALAALSAKVKFAFDPQSRLNPGRMHPIG